MTGSGDDPVQAGLVESLARPGGNVTGITSLSRELGGKRLDILKEALPKISRVAVIYEKASPSSVIELKNDLPVAAQALKLSLQPWEVRGSDDVERVFNAMSKQHVDGLYVSGSGSLMNVVQKNIVAHAIKKRLPSISSDTDFVDDGGLMSYGSDQTERYQRVAYYVDRILKGTKPGDLPVEQPMNFKFAVNLQTAKKIGVTINTDVLARATKIIR
jgi:putative ABC transport system substrate-binding protein